MATWCGPPDVTSFQRELLRQHISSILRRARPNAPPHMLNQIPALAGRIEATLFFTASNATEYSNRYTLEERMKSIRPCTGKRQRQTPNNSSCDLIKRHDDHKKRAMLGSSPKTKSSRSAYNVYVRINGIDSDNVSFGFMGCNSEQVVDKFNLDACSCSSYDSSCSEDSDDESEVELLSLADMDEISDFQNNPTTQSSLDPLYAYIDCIVYSQDPREIDRLMNAIQEFAQEHPEIPLRKFCEAFAYAFWLVGTNEKDTATPVDICSQESDVQPSFVDPQGNTSACTALVTACERICVQKSPVDIDLLKSILGRLLMPQINMEALPYQRALFCLVDRFAKVDPTRACEVICDTLLSKWPYRCSYLQMLGFMELESVFRVCEEHVVVRESIRAIRVVETCIRHANSQVVLTALNFAEKIAEFAQQYQATHSDLPKVFFQLYKSLEKCSRDHWSPGIRQKSASLGKTVNCIFKLDT